MPDWDANHPEATCEDCGRPNISWSIDSDRWNFATRTNGYWNGVLCPSCFVLRHEKAIGMTASWTLVPATPFRWVDKGVPLGITVGPPDTAELPDGEANRLLNEALGSLAREDDA